MRVAPCRVFLLPPLFFLAGTFCAAQLQTSEPSPIGAQKTARPARNKARKGRARRSGAARKRRSREAVLSQGRWLPQVRQSLERVIWEEGVDSPDYSATEPPVAVLAWDDVSANHNAGEALFYRLVTQVEFKFDRDFWGLIPMQYGRERIRAGYDGFSATPRSTWPKDAYYRVYRKAFFRCYQSICDQVGRSECARWSTTLLRGFPESELRAVVAQTIAQQLEGPVGEELVEDSPEDPDPVKVRVGLRKIPEMEDLYRKLMAKGFDVWVMSASNQWALEAFAQLYKVHPSRVIGVRSKVAEGNVTGEIQPPVPYGEGEAEAATLLIGGPLALVAGGAGDEKLMNYGPGLRIWISNKGAELPDTGKKKGWLVQPAFKPITAAQGAPPSP